MASIQVKCSSCQGELVYRHGKARSGIQRYRCRDCRHCFQLDYLYEANKPGVVEKISDMAMNGSGVRDTGRVLGISVTTVIAHLKKLAPPSVSPLPFNGASDKAGIELVCEMDEQWSYVGKKSQQRWLWYAWSPHLKRVFAYALGSRGDDTLKILLDRVKGFNFRLFCTDDWGAYDRLLPEDKHLVTKKFTQSIERQNLNFRTRIKRLQRKTICFSKSIEMHDKVIGEFINREFFQLI
ncbi:MAG: IS1 family transposase [Thiothrix sp.]